MGAEHGDGAIGNFVELLDKTRALAFQRLHHMAVVHDLVAHIDGLAIFLERPLDDIDRPDDAGAKAPRLGKNHAHHEPVGTFAKRPSPQMAATAPKNVFTFGGPPRP